MANLYAWTNNDGTVYTTSTNPVVGGEVYQADGTVYPYEFDLGNSTYTNNIQSGSDSNTLRLYGEPM